MPYNLFLQAGRIRYLHVIIALDPLDFAVGAVSRFHLLHRTVR
jgi:hypothetical protein